MRHARILRDPADVEPRLRAGAPTRSTRATFEQVVDALEHIVLEVKA